MATRYLRISVNTKLQLQMKPAKVRCCFIADMKKIDGKVVFLHYWACKIPILLKSEIPNAVSESKSPYAPEGTNVSFGWSLPTALLTQAFEYATKNKQYRQNQGKTGNERQII